MSPDPIATRVRSHLLGSHRGTVAATLDAADAVAAAWDGDRTANRRCVVDPLAREFDERGLRERFPAIIRDVADTAGIALPASPVAAPPYVAVTSLGPVLRAAGSERRVVVSIRAFEIATERPARYRRRDGGPAAVLDVRARRV